MATLGPATSSKDAISALIREGMNVARINMSHGDAASKQELVDLVREAAKEANRSIAILVDLQGPKIRLGKFADPPVFLEQDSTFTITIDSIAGDATRCSTSYTGLTGDVKPGDVLLLDDGRIKLRATEVTEREVVTKVEIAGPLSDHKGINLPNVPINVPALSEKDEVDLRWALHADVDFIALSFVRTAEDADDIRKIMEEEGVKLPIIAKIEKPQAVENLDEIMHAFDGFMVARGDLGVELPLEDVPLVQKIIIDKARRNAKPVIVATQMLDSMISSPRPTRAETSDVANAVLDGADAVMLSAETAVGKYPTETVHIMSRIIESTEDHGLPRMAGLLGSAKTKPGIICRAAQEVSEAINARYVVAFTITGDSARRMTRYRSRIPVIGLTPDPHVRNQLALSWGVETFLTPPLTQTDELVLQVDHILLDNNLARKGEQVVVIAGAPPGIPGSTNALRIHNVGDAIARVAPGYENVSLFKD